MGNLQGEVPPLSAEKFDAALSGALKDVLGLFNRQTEQLGVAYQRLEHQVERLNGELEAKNRELELQIAEVNRIKDYLNSILTGMSDGLVAIDTHNRITMLNRAAAEIIGDDTTGLEGSAFSTLFDSDPGSSSAGATVGKWQTGALVSRGGQRVPVSICSSPIHDTTGKDSGTVYIFQDLRELLSLKESVRRKERLAALGELAATVAHEVRNPLVGIEGFARLLARDLGEGTEHRLPVERIIEGCEIVKRVVNDLLLYARPMNYDLREHDLAGLINQVLMTLSPEIERLGVTVKRDWNGDARCAIIDRDKMVQALLNIVMNAVQSMSEHKLSAPKELTISLGKRTVPGGSELESGRAFTVIEVRDTGIGIQSGDLDSIFQPFFTTRQKGTGLGLAITARIVEEHSGRIEVVSEPGKGSCFSILLPINK